MPLTVQVAGRDLGTNWAAILEIKEGHNLVRAVIYKRIRHPMYAHFWIWVIAQGFILANGLVLAFGVIAWGLFYFRRVPKEEEMRIAEFGDKYQEYMRTTGRVIPKVVKNRCEIFSLPDTTPIAI